MLKTMEVFVVLGMLVFSGVAAAEKGIVETFNEGCASELATYCKDVQPGDGRLLACLYGRMAPAGRDAGVGRNRPRAIPALAASYARHVGADSSLHPRGDLQSARPDPTQVDRDPARRASVAGHRHQSGLRASGFCRYLCPVGGFIGLYSQAAPIELRVRDVRVCADHTTKTCYSGSAAGYGCPWMTFPAALKTNISCGLCLECLRTCPLDNIAINLRPMGSDFGNSRRVGLDEAFKSLLLVGSALVYVFVLQGPSSSLRAAAADVGSVAWLAYVTGFLLITLVLLPALLWPPRRRARSRAGGAA